jgi:uncharacterized protein
MNVLIDVDSWLRAAAGGLLIGLAAAVMIVFNGRIAGVSGVLGGLMFDGNGSDRRWRSMFLGGMVLGAVLLTTLVTSLPAGRLQTGWLGMAIAGLIVGYGTRMGSGCTSGHGVCGIARLSTRSVTATITFMAFGALTVFVIRHLLGAAS